MRMLLKGDEKIFLSEKRKRNSFSNPNVDIPFPLPIVASLLFPHLSTGGPVRAENIFQTNKVLNELGFDTFTLITN